jgi:hypothetical protein
MGSTLGSTVLLGGISVNLIRWSRALGEPTEAETLMIEREKEGGVPPVPVLLLGPFTHGSRTRNELPTWSTGTEGGGAFWGANHCKTRRFHPESRQVARLDAQCILLHCKYLAWNRTLYVPAIPFRVQAFWFALCECCPVVNPPRLKFPANRRSSCIQAAAFRSKPRSRYTE